MPTVGDYLVIHAFSFTLPKGGTTSQELPFEINDSSALRDDAILAFRVLPEKGKRLLKVEINDGDVNEARIVFQGTLVHSPGSNDFQTVHTVVQQKVHNILKVGQNKVNFKMSDGSGVATFSAVVLWFRHEV